MGRTRAVISPRSAGALVLIGTASWAADAEATFSIIAADTETGVVGAAVASCVGDETSLSEVVALQADVGGVLAQALLSTEGRDQAFSELREGASPNDALLSVLSSDFDADLESRQYAAVTVSGSVSAFTGKETLAVSNHRPATVNRMVYSVQGNILTGEGVLDALQLGFEATQGGVGARLVGALEQVTIRGGGDARCDPFSADAAYLEIRIPGEEPVIREVIAPDEDATLALVEESKAALPEEPDPLETQSYSTASGCQLGQRNSQRWWLVAVALGSFGWLRRRSAIVRAL